MRPAAFAIVAALAAATLFVGRALGTIRRVTSSLMQRRYDQDLAGTRPYQL